MTVIVNLKGEAISSFQRNNKIATPTSRGRRRGVYPAKAGLLAKTHEKVFQLSLFISYHLLPMFSNIRLLNC
jgi:hypothetical protein